MVRRILSALFLLLCVLSLKVVSLSPSVSEDLEYLGAYDSVVVGDVKQSHVRKRGVVVVGSYLSPSVEKVLALNPDVVFYSRGTDGRVIKKLESLGLEVVGVEEETLEDVLSTGELLISRLQLGERAKKRLDDAKRAAELLRKRGKERKKKFTFCFVIYWSRREIWVAGSGTFLSEGVRWMGGENVVKRNGWGKISREFLTFARPDFVVVTAEKGDEGKIRREISALLPGTEVVVVGREFDVPSLKVFTRLEKLEKALGL